jgi:hypothetical protein
MIRIPIPYEPEQAIPQRSTRVRREVNSIDAVNARFVEVWQTDAPRPQGGIEGRGGRIGMSMAQQAYDMNPTSSRLYRENMLSAPPNVPQPESKEHKDLRVELRLVLAELDRAPDSKDAQERYKFLTQRLKQIQIDSLSQNPYFEKYDVASDSRNIVRELRGSVYEDVVNRGEEESARLLKRTMGYELMRPRMTDTSKIYR